MAWLSKTKGVFSQAVLGTAVSTLMEGDKEGSQSSLSLHRGMFRVLALGLQGPKCYPEVAEILEPNGRGTKCCVSRKWHGDRKFLLVRLF